MPPFLFRLGLLLLLALQAAAAPTGPGLQSLRFERLRAAQLGTNGSLQCGRQDDLGQMWLGTSYGLVRYDGRRGRLFGSDPRDSASLSHPWVQDLAFLPDGRLLVATAGGLDLFDPQLERAERMSLPGKRTGAQRAMLSLAPAVDGWWWVQGHFELMQFHPQRRQFRAVALAGLHPWLKGLRVLMRGLQADGQGGAWLVAGAELLHVDATGQVLRRWPLPAATTPRSAIQAMALDADGRAWLGSVDGVIVMDLADGRASDLPQRLGLPTGTAHALLRDSDGGIWMAFGGAGLWHWPRGAALAESHQYHPALPHSLLSNAVSTVFQDRSGVLWVGAWGDGASLADTQSGGFRSYGAVYGEPASLSHNSVKTIEPDGPEHAWVGSYGGGLDRLHLPSGTAQHIDPQGLPIKYMRKLLQQPGRGLWVGSDAGLFLLDTATLRLRRVDLGDTVGNGVSVGALALGAEGRLWVGTASGLVEVAPDLRGRRHGRLASPTTFDRVSHLLLDRQGRLWVGSENGLLLYQAGGLVPALKPDAELAKPEELKVSGLIEDRTGELWVGSQLGLHRLASDGAGWRLRAWSRAVGMPEAAVHNFQNAADGSLWMSTDLGLTRLAPDRRTARLFPAGSGQMPAGFSHSSSATAADGRLFYGGDGLLVFDPLRLRDNGTAPAVLLSDLRVFNRSLRDEPGPDKPGEAATNLAALGVQGPLERATTLRLSHREAMVSFDLRAQHFAGRELLRYAWKLDGFDRDWIYGKPGEGLATYTNLEAGNFRLLAKAANPDGVWGEARELLAVEVLPPWWRALWFRGLVLLLLLSAMATAWHLRLRRLQRTQRELEAEVTRRTAEVRAQRQQIATLSEIGRELTASLDLGAIQRALFEHVESLMPAAVFGVGLVNREERVVEFDYMVERGRAFKPYRRSLDVPEQPAARCVASGEALLIEEFGHDNRIVDAAVRETEGQRLQLADGSEPSQARSGLYVPLKVKGQVIGVLSVLSDQAHAFKKTHLDMLQTLGAYAAVALDNADAYRQLKAAQAQLVEQEKLSSMGSLVAGVAHEMNTPLGNALMAASTLQDETRQLRSALSEGQLRRSVLQGFFDAADGGFELLLRSLERAAHLVGSFKQLAVSQASEPRRSFELAELAEELRLSHAAPLREAGHMLELAVPQGLWMDSYPASLGQVLGHLISNALVHGLAGRQEGLLRLSAEPLAGERLRLRFSDDGRGIAPEHLGRVFDPFFTTRLGSGSNGLGLHLCYTIVGSVLGGRITASSTPGQGAVFEIVLPRRAPG